MANPARLIVGSAQLHAVEDELAARIPDHRHELIRVIVGDRMACLETTVVAPLTHEYAPACVWWWLDESGKVAAEVGWFDWADRSKHSMQSHGTVPPSRGVGGPRDDSWYASVAEEYARHWSHDPVGAALDMFAEDCTSGHVGRSENRGVAELARARQLQLDELPVPGRWMQLHRVVGEGSALAMLITIGDSSRVTRGTVVLTFDGDDLIISERTYCDWSKSVTRQDPGLQPGSSPPVGSLEWRLRAG